MKGIQMRGGTGRIILWSAVTVAGGTVLFKKLGIRVPGFNG